MRVYQTNEIKNIALLGSAGSGKTTLAESMLFEAGVIKRKGSVEAKNTVSDYFPVELEYGYSVFRASTTQWRRRSMLSPKRPGIRAIGWPRRSLFWVTLSPSRIISLRPRPRSRASKAAINPRLARPMMFLTMSGCVLTSLKN